jgi:hypothetical protein
VRGARRQEEEEEGTVRGQVALQPEPVDRAVGEVAVEDVVRIVGGRVGVVPDTSIGRYWFVAAPMKP